MARLPDPPEIPGVEHRFHTVGDVRLHVAHAGPPDGPAVLLVHGWPQHWWVWRDVIPRLAQGYRVICPDLRGLGWSSEPGHGYDKESLAGDVLALMAHLGLERATWVGHDWGAYCGFLAALRAPDRIRRLVALSAPHPWPSRRDRRNPLRLAAFAYQVPLSLPFVGRGMMRAGAARLVLRVARSRGRFSDRELEIYDATLRTPAGARATVGYYRTFTTRELAPLMAGRYATSRLSVPTHLMMGDRDPIARGSRLDGYEAHARTLSVEWVAGAGHFLPEEAPELVTDRILEMLARDA